MDDPSREDERPGLPRWRAVLAEVANAFPQEDGSPLGTARREVALARIEQAFIQVERELKLLGDIDHAVLTDVPLTQLTATVCNDVNSILETDGSAIYHLRGTALVEQVVAGEMAWARKWWEEHPEIVAASLASDVQSIRITQEFSGAPSDGQLLVATIRPDQHAVGLIAVWAGEFDKLNGADFEFLKSLGRQLSIAYDNSQLVDSERLMSEIDALFFGAPSHKAVTRAFAKVAEHFAALPEHQDDRLQILFPSTPDTLEIVYSSAPDDIGLVIAMNESVCGEALQQQRTIVINDVKGTALPYLSFLGEDVRSECAVPIIIGSTAVAVFNVETPHVDAYDGYYAFFIERYVRQLRFLIAFARLQDDVLDRLQTENADHVFVAMSAAAADLLHQVNNKLSSLKVRLTQLRRQVDEPTIALVDKCLQLAEEALAAPEAMRTRLLEVAAPEVNDVVRRVVVALAEEFDTVRFETSQLREGIPSIKTFLLHEVLVNVIRNAAKAVSRMPPGATLPTGWVPTVVISTRVRSRKGVVSSSVVIEVSDNGPGIAPDMMTHLFDIGLKRDGDSGMGWGFGLYFVEKAVRRVGGEISAISPSSGGALVRITYPVRRMQVEGSYSGLNGERGNSHD